MKLLELINRTNLDMSKGARMKRAESMGFDTSTVWYHANTGGIEGEGFDDSRLPAADPDRPFNAHWFSHEPSEHAAYPSSGNTITPVFLALRKEAPHGVWRKLTGRVHDAWDKGDNKRNAADMIREKLVSMGYTHAIRGREPIDADELKRTGETSFMTSTGTKVTLKWEKLMLPAKHPDYTGEEMESIKAYVEAKRMYDTYYTLVIDTVMNNTMTPEKSEELKAKGIELKNNMEQSKVVADAAEERAYEVVNAGREEIDSLEMYDDFIGHVTGYSSLEDFEASSPEKEDIAVLDPSIIRSIHAAFDPAEEGNNKIMSSIGESRLNEVRGPHEGKELKLMMQGKKPLAMTELRSPYMSEKEQALWKQAIDSGQFIHRAGQTITTPQSKDKRHQTDFIALPGEEWRFELIQKLYDDVERRDDMTDAHHTILGKLLGYSDADIRHFVTGFDDHGDDGFSDEDRAMAKRMGYKVNEAAWNEYVPPPKAPMVGYHITSTENRDNIRMHGLDPKYSGSRDEFDDMAGGAVYFYTGGIHDQHPTSDIWKADLRGLDVDYDVVQVTGQAGWGDNEHWWAVYDLVVPDRLKLVQKGTG